MNFEILRGNIVDADERVDAIVCPANAELKESGGASKAIFEAAGRRKLSKECRKIKSCEVGFAELTLAYNLKCKAIIHTVVPQWIDGNNDEYRLLSTAYLSTLKLADTMGFNSVAIPLLASGAAGFEHELAFEIAVKSIEMYDANNLKDVILVIFNNQANDIAVAQGYDVGILPRKLANNAEDNQRKEENKKFFENIGEKLKKLGNEGFRLGKEIWKDPENRKLVLLAATAVMDILNKRGKTNGGNNKH